MRSPRNLLIVAALLFVFGIALLFTAHGGDNDFGWFAYAPMISGSTFYVLSTQQVLGWVIGWIASLLVAGVIGHRIATKRRPSA